MRAGQTRAASHLSSKKVRRKTRRGGGGGDKAGGATRIVFLRRGVLEVERGRVEGRVEGKQDISRRSNAPCRRHFSV